MPEPTPPQPDRSAQKEARAQAAAVANYLLSVTAR
jgi:hypothetical protein